MNKFPRIGQYRQAVREVTGRARFVGLDDDNYPIYDANRDIPTLTYRGTVKLHGTNSAVRLKDGVLTCQSRNNVITPEKDNAGFARWVHSLDREVWNSLFSDAGVLGEAHSLRNNGLPASDEDITIYGEWCGKGIQSGCAIHNLDKMFVIFGLRFGTDDDTVWVDGSELCGSRFGFAGEDYRIFNILDFPTFEIDIDFNHPKAVQNRLSELTLEVEKECPFGAEFDVSGVGEGIVWRPVDPEWSAGRFWFKTKGEKHSASKVKTIAPVDPEKLASVQAFVDHVVTERRLEQGIEYVNEQGAELSRKSTGVFLKWFMGDVFTEEKDTLETSGLTNKEVAKPVQTAARLWFFQYVDRF